MFDVILALPSVPLPSVPSPILRLCKSVQKYYIVPPTAADNIPQKLTHHSPPDENTVELDPAMRDGAGKRSAVRDCEAQTVLSRYTRIAETGRLTSLDFNIAPYAVSVMSEIKEAPSKLRRAFSESDAVVRVTQPIDHYRGSMRGCLGAGHHLLPVEPICTHAEEAAYAARKLQDLQNFHLASMAELGTLQESYAQSSKIIVDERAQYEEKNQQLAQYKEENEQLAIRYRSLHQKHYSEKKFTAQRSIWLLIRVRALSNKEIATISTLPLTTFKPCFIRDKVSLTCHPAQDVSESTSTPEPFTIDHYFGPSSNNGDIYDEVEPLMNIFFHGRDVCIFTDGQSGSGKSYTMFKGIDALSLLIARSVFSWKCAKVDKRHVTCSVIEIYLDQLYNLQATVGEEKADLTRAKRGDYDKPVPSASALVELLKEARARLHVKRTPENTESSRGHFVCSLVLTQLSLDKPTVKSRITLIDLAGAERMANSSYSVETKTKPSRIAGTKAKSSSSTVGPKAKRSDPTEAGVDPSVAAAETAFISNSRGALRTLLTEFKNDKPAAGVDQVR